MAITRRQFIVVGAVGSLVLALGGVGVGLSLAFRPSVHREPNTPLVALSPLGFSILAAVAGALVDVPDQPDADEAGVAEGVDALLARLHPAVTAELEQGLRLLENAAVSAVLEGRFTTFSASDRATQQAVLLAWSESEYSLFRRVFRALHGLCMSVYWSQPERHVACGYAGPPDLSMLMPEAP
ncbi:MAG: gluconate 2-dehydrogenase subunit 3 family protein [Myxococcota bacterium]